MKQFVILFFILFNYLCYSKTWKVGLSKTYALPSKVSSLVSDGDTVEIDSGLYVMDVAKWTANNLLIRGVKGRARLDAQGKSYGNKAIWVIAGKNTKVENIEFFNCRVPDFNGAGIRLEAANLTVTNCYFHHNEMGLLAGDIANCKIVVENTELAYNGYGDGYSHNIYVNHIDTFVFRYNYSHDAHVGHEVKSRAYNNYILYNRISSEKGTDSRNIDLPNGGKVFLIGNIIVQGANSQNSNIIGYGLEGLTNPVIHEVYAINNTIVNDRVSGSFFSFQSGTAFFKAYNNIIAGNGVFILGTQPTQIDTASNVINSNISAFNFSNPQDFDYTFKIKSLLVFDKGISPGKAGNFLLTPSKIYVHPMMESDRCIFQNIDIGAFESCVFLGISNIKSDIKIFPNPVSDKVLIENFEYNSFRIYDSNGKLVKEGNSEGFIDVSGLYSGLYFVSLSAGKNTYFSKFIKL